MAVCFIREVERKFVPMQGCWGEVQSDQEQIEWCRKNCFLLLGSNAWSSCLQLLNIEIEWVMFLYLFIFIEIPYLSSLFKIIFGRE